MKKMKLRPSVAVKPRCPNAWCRNVLTLDRTDPAKPVWRCPACRWREP